MSSVTNPIVDAVAGFFTEDPSAFTTHRFVTAIAKCEDYASVGRLALDFLETQTLIFAENMNRPNTPDRWSLAQLLDDVIKAWPQEWQAPLGEKLAGAFAS